MGRNGDKKDNSRKSLRRILKVDVMTDSENKGFIAYCTNPFHLGTIQKAKYEEDCIKEEPCPYLRKAYFQS